MRSVEVPAFVDRGATTDGPGGVLAAGPGRLRPGGMWSGGFARPKPASSRAQRYVAEFGGGRSEKASPTTDESGKRSSWRVSPNL